MMDEKRGTLAAIAVLGLVIAILGVFLVNTNTALNKAETENRHVSAQLRETEAALTVVEQDLTDAEEMIVGCAGQAGLYRYAVEGLAAKVITLLESGVFPDIQPEVDAKTEADSFTCK